MNTELKPYAKVNDIIEAVELHITYEYDDLVFVEHNPFIIRFDLDEPSRIYLHFNVDCEPEAVESLSAALIANAKQRGLDLFVDKKYTMVPKEENDELELHFES